MVLENIHNLPKRLFGENGNEGVLSGIAERHQQEWLFVLWPLQDRIQETHGTGGMGQRGYARCVQGSQQETNGNATESIA